MIRHFLLFLLCAMFVALPCDMSAEVTYSPSLDKALNALDDVLGIRQDRLKHFESKADSLRRFMGRAELSYDEEIGQIEEIISTFRHRDVDSVWFYSNRAIKLARANGDSVRAMRHYISQIQVMPLRGYIHESIVRMDSLAHMKLDRDLKRYFYENAWDTYLCLTSLYSPKSVNYEYLGYFVAINDSLLEITPPDVLEHKLYLGCHYLGEEQISLAIATLTDYIEKLPMPSDEFNRAASLLALANYIRGRVEHWLYYMALNAHSEVLMGYADGEALRQLSAGLYTRGDTKRSYSYLFASQDNFAISGATTRSIHAAGVYPMIMDAYRSSVERYTRVLYVLIGCLVLIGVLIVVIMRNKSHDVERLRDLKEKLAEANRVKEDYIAEFLNLCAVYMDKIEEFNRTVNRKIAAGQIEDLYGMVKSGRFVEEQSRLFYEVFDSAFINIYPNFISEVNGLLLDDRKFVLADPKKLSPELRILAFMRLGLDDSARIARFLGLSLNTVYTYRNRLKSRAKNRDTFEKDMRSIGNVS